MARITKADIRATKKAEYVSKRIQQTAQAWAEIQAKKSGGAAADFLAVCLASKEAESAIFQAEFERANPVKVKPRAHKKPTQTFAQWFEGADMPEVDPANGKWRDLETGLYFN